MKKRLKMYIKKKWRWLSQLRRILFWIPILTLVVGFLISVSVYNHLQNLEFESRKQATLQQATETVNQVDLQLSNSLLRAQTYEESIGGYEKNYRISKAYISQTLEYTIFHRLSIFKYDTKSKVKNGFKLILRINKQDVTSTETIKNDYISSPELFEAIQNLIRSSSYHHALIFESKNEIRFAILMHSKFRKEVYFLFSTPLLSIFKKFNFDNLSKIIVYDLEKNNQWMIMQKGEEKYISRISNNKSVSSHDEFEFNFDKGLPQSGLSLGLRFLYNQQSIPIITSARIVATLSFVLTIIISYLFYVLIASNRNANRLIIKKAVDLEKTAHDLQIALDTKSKFLGKVSHEIRTPLNLILGMIDLCSENDMDQKLQNYLKSMKSSGDHLLNMIDDLLELSKSEADSFSFERKKTNLVQFLTDIVKLIAFECRSKNLLIYTYFDPKLPQVIVCDPNRLRQVLLNLLRNAFKYTNEGHIELNVFLRNSNINTSSIRFEVKDTGIGIQSDKLNKIFDAFFQVENPSTFAEGGVGLGLSIVKEIVKKMNGQIFVHSDPKSGSEFQVDLDFEVQNAHYWVDAYKLKNPVQKKLFIISADPLFQKTFSVLGTHPLVQLFPLVGSNESDWPLDRFSEENIFIIIDLLKQ